MATNVSAFQVLLQLKDELTDKLKGPLAALVGVGSAVGLVTKALEDQAEAEAGINKLNQTLANQGQLVGDTSSEFIKLSQALTDVSTFSDDAILALETQFINLGKNRGEVERLTRATIDYATYSGQDLTSAASAVSRGLSGSARAFKQYGIEVDSGADKTTIFNQLVGQMESKFSGSALNATKTMTGQLSILKREIGEASESFGKFLGSLGESDGILGTVTGWVKDFSSFLGGPAILAMSEYSAQWRELVAWMLKTVTVGFDLLTKIPLIGGSIKTANDETKKWAKELEDTAAKIREHGNQSATSAGKLLDLKNKTEAQVKAEKALAESIKKTEAAREASKKADEEAAKALKDLAELGSQLSGRALAEKADKLAKALAMPGVFAAATGNRQHLEALYKQITELTDKGLKDLPPALQQVVDGFEDLQLGTIRLEAAGPPLADIVTNVEALGKAFETAGPPIEDILGDKDFENWLLNQRGNIADAERKTIDWSQALSDLANAFQALGVSADSTLSKIVVGFTTGLAASQNLIKSMGNVNNMSTSGGYSHLDWNKLSGKEKVSAGASMFGPAATAYKSGSVGGGAATGAAAGSAFGPYGIAIGAAAGALLGWAGKAKKAREEMKALTDDFVKSHGGLAQLEQDAMKAGISLDKMFNAKSAKELSGIITDIDSQLSTWNEAQEKLNAAIEKYGFTIEELGPKFQQQRIDEMALELLQDFRLLTAAGIDSDVVLTRMAGGFNTLLQNAMKTGASIPESLRGPLEKLLEMGLLVDENGNKLEDLSAVSFEKTLTEAMDAAVKAIDRLVAALRGVPTSISTKHTTYHEDVFDDDPDSRRQHKDSAGGFHGWVTGPTRFLVGEAGAERVDVTPGSGKGGSGMDSTAIVRRLEAIEALLRGQRIAFRDAVLLGKAG